MECHWAVIALSPPAVDADVPAAARTDRRARGKPGSHTHLGLFSQIPISEHTEMTTIS